ncbi:MAG TPA: N-methyl-L-tryptophan oxidase [Bryobacteraceae bacterium]|nr:N-methyl-L-tryptophan oxidase [Bryobacteraceae bacterium]
MLTRDIVVIGAGSFGTWTALHLRRAGQSVLLLDAWDPGHSRSSSGGESRIIRMGYGADGLYTKMAWRSLAQWQDLFRATDRALFRRTGVLWVARFGDPYSESTQRTLERTKVPVEVLSATELAARYPQMILRDDRAFGILESESGALMARRAVAAVVESSVRSGVEYMRAAVMPPIGPAKLDSIRTTDGEQIRAGVFVFACGAWLPKLFPDLLRTRIFPTRQEVLFFAPPAGDRRFCPPHFPIWIDFTDPRGPYGFPDLEGRGFKVAFDRHGPEFDPDTGDRSISTESVSEARAFLAERFPAMQNAPLTESRVCQYENTSNGDFLIDQHPELANVWLVGGGSGHGFKHGPAVGEYITARIIQGAVAERRFSLVAKGQAQSRTVF